MGRISEIDVVIPWVDGTDAEWQKERNRYNVDQSRKLDSFYRDWKLLRYWFRGIEKNLDWIRKIHFVTWGHLPLWLNTEHPKLHIVKHEDYIPQKYLPVFSSIPIELNFHRIQDLTENFIIANDDVYFVEKVDRGYFFKEDLPCDYLSLRPITEIGSTGFGHIMWEDISCINRNFDMKECMMSNKSKWFSEAYPDSIVENNRALCKLHFFPGFAWDHQFMPVCKRTFEIVWGKEYPLLDQTCSSKFRVIRNCTNWLIRYWQLASGQFIPFARPSAEYVQTCDSEEALRDCILSKRNKIICVNEGVKGVDFEKRSSYIRDLFQIRLPEISSFEKF